jgi:hypothetical protein
MTLLVSLVCLGRDRVLVEQKTLCVQFARPGFIFLVLPRAPNVHVLLPPFFLTCALACYELRLEVIDDL